jgi:hypothetical protein
MICSQYLYVTTRWDILSADLRDYKNYKKIERKDLLKLQRKIHEDYFNVAGLHFTKHPDIEIPEKTYHPLELE